MADTTTTQAALFDFVQLWTEDVRSGHPLPLQEYMARFPGHEQAIAREYLRLTDTRDPSRHGIVSSTGSPTLEELVARLQRPRRTDERYEPSSEVARGGMGAILRARDQDLHRDVAMKVLLGHGSRQVSRFLEEAQVTGQLEHPGVVPVHDLGVDGDGRVFFTMRLVEGRDLREVIESVHAQSGDWSLPRALEVLLKVCDTMAFAHSRGVVHRDLKPSNVRVGEFGEVYVMDWGLALVRGTAPSSISSTVNSERASERIRSSESPILTREGDVLGTPSYMAPEQAEGHAGTVGPEADVYAVGAMLYHLIAGDPPYLGSETTTSSDAVLARVRRGPPESLRAVVPSVPAELVSICEKAMARDPAARYPSLREVAEDLRAFLEGRVVRAHRTGAWVELAKWVRRNRSLAASIAITLALAASLLTAVAVVESKARERLQLLADAHAAVDLLSRAKAIVPSGPDEVPPLERWLRDAHDLVSRRDDFARELERLRSRALPFDADNPDETAARRKREERIKYMHRVIDVYRKELTVMSRTGRRSFELLTVPGVQEKLRSFEENLQQVESAPLTRISWTFPDHEDQLRFDTLAALLPRLEELLGSAQADGWVVRMQRRLDSARTLRTRTIESVNANWESAINSIRDKTACPKYQGLVISPQLGLVPLHRDPTSGLWEFLHEQSGAAPAEGTDGHWVVGDQTGIVLVLIPEGEFAMGAQREDPSAGQFDPSALPNESASIDGARAPFPGLLEPFFLSKYEVTRAQWRRLSGHDPSVLTPESHPELVGPGSHPLDSVDWTEAQEVLREFGLKLPSEARWEYSARAGTTTPWWTGSERDSLRGAANLADGGSKGSRFIEEGAWMDWPDFDDGFRALAPVGSFRPNAFGLYDVCGNVSEWCGDTGFTSYDRWTDSRFGDLERAISGEGLRIRRGGSFATSAVFCRSAARTICGPGDARPDTGVRPARDLDR